MKQKNISYLIIFHLIILFSGCYNKPDYPSTPIIYYKSIEIGNGKIADTIRVTIKIQDKEGDLGLESNEADPKFQTTNPDGSINSFYHNFFIQTLRKEGENYVPVNFPDGQELHGRFPIFSTEKGENTMEVTLTYEFLVYFLFGSPVKQDDTLKFKIQVADRALNLSNTILTEEVKL